MAITQQRADELDEIYQRLKERLSEVDDKYSVSAHDVEMDLPETLGLEHMQYTPKTEEELQTIAEAQTANAYQDKLRSLTNSYNAKISANSQKQSKLTSSHNAKLSTMLAEYNVNCDKIIQRLIDNGLMFSSLITSEVQKERSAYTSRVGNENTSYTSELSVLTAQSGQLQDDYEDNCDQLQAEHENDVAEAYRKLLQAETKLVNSVEKYNRSLDEKEVKYRASREKSLEYAQQREYERALNAARVYAELGEVGVENLISTEKFNICKSAFNMLNSEEANYILDTDNFLQGSLGIYYDYLVDWLNL